MPERYAVSHENGRWQVGCHDCSCHLGNLPDNSASDNWIGALIMKHDADYHPRLATVTLTLAENGTIRVRCARCEQTWHVYAHEAVEEAMTHQGTCRII